MFEGGFLGLDNIGVFDRSAPLPTGGYLEQADGTAWMALFSQNMLEICSELALSKPAYADMALKFVEHYLWIASSMIHTGDDVGMWDEQDGFFYDVLRLPDGRAERLKVRSMVGLLPLCAVTVFEGALLKKYPELVPRLMRFLNARPELSALIHDPSARGEKDRRLGAILNEEKLRRVLSRMLDEHEFLSPYGIRSLSRYHATHPYRVNVGNQEFGVSYLPAESDSGMFGGNSNWRGPIWMPVNALIIRALLQVLLVLRRSLHDRVSNRIRPADDAVRGGQGHFRAPGRYFSAKRRQSSTCLRCGEEVPGRSALARSPALLRVLPRRQRRRPRRQPSNRVDGDHRALDALVRDDVSGSHRRSGPRVRVEGAAARRRAKSLSGDERSRQ